MTATTGGKPYAIGMVDKNGWFRVRRVMFGKLAASYEIRNRGEEIRAVTLAVADKPTRPLTTPMGRYHFLLRQARIQTLARE